MQRASSHGSQQESESLIGSFQPERDSHSVQLYISERLEDLEHRLETFLDQMTEEMALEVEREQQHLMLMQDQVMLPKTFLLRFLSYRRFLKSGRLQSVPRGNLLLSHCRKIDCHQPLTLP